MLLTHKKSWQLIYQLIIKSSHFLREMLLIPTKYNCTLYHAFLHNCAHPRVAMHTVNAELMGAHSRWITEGFFVWWLWWLSLFVSIQSFANIISSPFWIYSVPVTTIYKLVRQWLISSISLLVWKMPQWRFEKIPCINIYYSIRNSIHYILPISNIYTKTN